MWLRFGLWLQLTRTVGDGVDHFRIVCRTGQILPKVGRIFSSPSQWCIINLLIACQPSQVFEYQQGLQALMMPTHIRMMRASTRAGHGRVKGTHVETIIGESTRQ